NDTQILCSVNLAERSLAMLSIPRDTYVAGEYDPPKAKNIYKSYDEQRRIGAVKDAVRGMVGFSVDYYYLIDQQTLTEALSLVGGLTFDVPESPDYHSLKSGNQTLDGKKAFELFRFKNSWTDVETDPARVQRTFLLALLDKLLGDEARISEICTKLSQVAKTDLTVEELAYMAYLLKDFDFDDAFSRALPGGEKEIDDEVYYEVDPEDAVELLNEHFNPLKKELTVFNVNFRQEQGASGEGYYSDYGHSSSTTESDGDEESSETEPDNTDETESTDPTEGTQDGGETGEPTESENSTETEATTQTEAPTETEDSGDSGNGTP
ncbi:MAG: LCP family protein, partial [Oscillospiraceae bacterium]|nr:LCP family protein [Oscillospiraceae bacterium]